MGTKTKDNIEQQIEAVKLANPSGNSSGDDVQPADPSRPENAKNKYIDLGIGTAATKNLEAAPIVLYASKWRGSKAPYIYDFGEEYANAVIFISYDSLNGNQAANAALINGRVCSGALSSLIAWGKKPEVDIPVLFTCFK